MLHPLNPFPVLLSFTLLAPFFLRLVLGVTFIHFGTRTLKTKNYKAVRSYLEIIVGFMLIVGFYTQIGAAAAALIMLYELILKIRRRAFLTDGVNYYLILFVIAISLLFSGAGFFAFDLPL